jgi:predicted RNase H-like HicB family nuclease
MPKFLAHFTTEDGTISFDIPELPGFHACFDLDEVDTFEAAIHSAEEVLADFTGVMMDEGRALPGPVTLSVQMDDPNSTDDSGKRRYDRVVLLTARPRSAQPKRINLSIDTATLAKIDECAAQRGMTRSGYLAAAAMAYD